MNWKDSAIDLPKFVEEINSTTNFDIDSFSEVFRQDFFPRFRGNRDHM